jgi:uncharacterized protein YbjT (DUF2867 family)
VLPDIEWARAELESGQGVAEAAAGAQVIVHAASDPRRRDGKIDVEGTRLLLQQARSAGATHFVYISIVGIDRVPYFYYKHKLAAEEMIAGASVPWSILRTTQFHNLIDMFLKPFMKFPIVLLPTDWQAQPVDVGEVAEALCSIVAAGPSGRLPDMGGPEVLRSGNMARVWLKARRMRRLMIHLPLPGQVAHGFRQGYTTCPDRRIGQITWAEWLKKKYSVNESNSG